MSVFTLEAHIQDAVPDSLHDFVQNTITSAPPVDKPLTSAQLIKQEAAQRLDAAWEKRIILARWIIDLGPIVNTASKTKCGGSTPAKRSLEEPDSDSGPSTKRLRRDDGTPQPTTPSPLLSPLKTLQPLKRVHLKPVGQKSAGFERGHDLFAVRVESGSISEALKFRLQLSDTRKEMLNCALRLCDVHEKSRARTLTYLGMETKQGKSSLKLVLEFCWKDAARLDDALIFSPSVMKHQILDANRILSRLYSTFSRQTQNSKGPRLFYEAVHVPKYDPKDAKDEMEVPGLQTGLYPFQKRSVRWMLEREGAKSAAQAELATSFHNGFEQLTDADGKACLFNPWLELFTTDQGVTRDTISDLRGGILAEEMGLGKTVELISLIQMHKRDENDAGFRNGLHHSGATLVVAPKTIITQWQQELSTHCPGLHVMTYDNSRLSKSRLTEEEHIANLTSHDVVLCDYHLLDTELHLATAPPDRSRRTERRFERPKSLLTQIHWWRVILDEAQMVESSTTAAAKVAVRIPRQNAWAVSGTPLKRDPADLFGLFTFLGLEPYSLSPKLFDNLIDNYSLVFKDLIGRVALRHTKDLVKADLQLPPQKRIVLSVPFTAVEEQNYNQLFEEMTVQCNLKLDGSPGDELWEPNDPETLSRMRAWLVRLRKVCLHPEVAGPRQGRNARDNPLRTVDEVLAVMIENNDTSLRVEERARLTSILKRGQLLENAKRPEESLDLWGEVLEEAQEMILSDNAALKIELQRLKDAGAPDLQGDGHDDDAASSKVSRLRNRIRNSIEIQHSAVFFMGNAYYQIKTDESLTPPGSERFAELDKMESQRYEGAKICRMQLLSSASAHVMSFIDKIRAMSKSDGFVKITGMTDPPLTGGIEVRKHFEALEDITDTLNQQAELLDDWREKLIKAVLLPLVDQEDTNITGEEYETSTKQEDEIHVYMEALRLLIADRGQLITGQRNIHIRREAAQLYQKAATGKGHSPELMKDLLAQANKIRPPENVDGDVQFFLQKTVPALVQLRDSLQARSGRAGELAAVTKLLNHVKPQQTEQLKITAALDKELELFSNAINARVEYYRQLQVISDMVAPIEEELNDDQLARRLLLMRQDEQYAKLRATNFRRRGTFLNHLKANPNAEKEERICPICTDHFDNGILTSCGHQFCKDCIQHWFNTHSTCPNCKQTLRKGDLHPITFKPMQLSIQEDVQTRSPSTDSTNPPESRSEEKGIYTGLDPKSLDEIKSIDLPKSYGTKIDMLARHIIWLREKDPGAKCIIFSQFREFFTVLGDAFDRFRIGWASMAGSDSQKNIQLFKKERRIEVLFLHAKAQAAGLNLINATHVFLVEPLLNTAIELQAIARVHRIGQHHATTIWQYLIENTVEKAIYDISVERRLSYIQSVPKRAGRARLSLPNAGDYEAEIDAANSLEIETPVADLLAKGQEGGEQVAKDDVWPCLFKYRPAAQSALAGLAEQTTNAFVAGEAAEARRQDMAIR